MDPINKSMVIDNHINSKLNHNNNCNFKVDQMICMKGYPVNGETIAGNQDDNINYDTTINYQPDESDKIKLSKSVRETIFDDVDHYFNQLSNYLKSSNSKVNHKQSESSLIALQIGFNQILMTSSHYEYKHLPANGFVTYCVLIRSWLIRCCEKLNCNNQADQVAQKSFLNDIQIVIKGFLLIKEMLMHFHQTQLEAHQVSISTSESGDEMNDDNDNYNDDADNDNNELDLPLFSATIDETVYQLDKCLQSSDFQEALARSFSMFWLSPRTKMIFQLYQKGISWTYANFIKSWRVLASKRYRCKTFVKLANRANIGFPVDVAAVIDGHLTRKVCRNLLYRNKDAIGSNFWINRQGRWFVPPIGPGIVEENPIINRRPQIRCRFIRHRCKPIRTELLIFHCHGSGFILSRPDVHDAYLKPWVAQLDGVSILSVDYSLMAKYPDQFQDVLDAYLWVTSGDESVVEKIGFHPKKIILIGDSAGSMLAMSIPLLLHEIRKKSQSNENNNRNNLNNNNIETPSTPINMPFAFISFYGTFQLTGAWSSSRIMTIFDPLLHYGNILAIAGCLSGIQGRIDTPKDIPKNRLAKVSSYIAEDIRLVSKLAKKKSKIENFQFLIFSFLLIERSFLPRKVHPWYIDNNRIAGDQFQSLFKRLQSPYLNCPTFDSYEALKEMSLCLITSFGCIFLDDNIALARSWKGPCEVHVLEGQIHGFLFMRHEKAAIQFANEKVIQFVNKLIKSESSANSDQ